ncbi:MAG TPA: glycosyltransferase family 39 protein, partial [Polyangiaceae bacterium]
MGQTTPEFHGRTKISRGVWRDLALLALARAAATAVIGAMGYVALSDDDFARVTIAQQFAVAPKLDPSGTSWLPFPFWLTGAAMRLLDPSLGVARVAAAVFAIGATWLVYAGARSWGLSSERALAAALLINVVPSAALLGSLTTPELPTAALAVFAVLAVTAPAHPTARRAVAVSAAMCAATLSRYEAWPVAVVVAAYALARRDATKRWRVGVALASLAGPALWMLDNLVLHGDALSFVHRVAAYRAALGTGAPSRAGALGAIAVIIAAAIAALYALYRRGQSGTISPFVAWAGSALALGLFLLAGEVTGGAPTHHAERTLLFLWLLGAVAVVIFADTPKRRVALAAAVALFLAGDSLVQFAEPGIDRSNEELIGTNLRSLVERGGRVYIATKDYGYFAIAAAFGRPLDVVIDSTHDPRKKGEPSILDDRSRVLERLQAERASWLVAPSAAFLPFALTFRTSVGD